VMEAYSRLERLVLSGPKTSVWLWLVAVLVCSLPLAVAADSKSEKLMESQLTLDQIVNRMEEARLRNKQTPPFLMTREYQMFKGDETKPASEVKAQINVVPPSERDFRIIESQGSNHGEKVVRQILEHEAKAEKTNPSPTAVTTGNYDFAFEGREKFEGVNCYVLEMKPKRQEPSLINGRAWVDPNTFAIRKIEGKMAKSPSWWVKDVNMVINFGEIGGIWTQTASHAVAEVRVVGRYTMVGRAVDVQTAGTVASNARPQKKIFERRRNDLPAAFLYGSAIPRR